MQIGEVDLIQRIFIRWQMNLVLTCCNLIFNSLISGKSGHRTATEEVL